MKFKESANIYNSEDSFLIWDPIGPTIENINNWYSDYPSDLLYQTVSAFAIGLIFSPWSRGLVLLLLFFLLYEILYSLFNPNFTTRNLLTRLAVIGSAFLGWLVGRIIIGDRHPLDSEYKDNNDGVGLDDLKTERYRKNKENNKICKKGPLYSNKNGNCSISGQQFEHVIRNLEIRRKY